MPEFIEPLRNRKGRTYEARMYELIIWRQWVWLAHNGKCAMEYQGRDYSHLQCDTCDRLEERYRDCYNALREFQEQRDKK